MYTRLWGGGGGEAASHKAGAPSVKEKTRYYGCFS